jgi:CubicO group peptidase (beta-lactamase class C family)
MKLIRGLLKLILGVIALVIVLLVGLVTTMWIADPTVPKNIFFGQPITAPAAVERSQPQVRVAGKPQSDLQAINESPTNESSQSVDPTVFDPVIFAEAIDYAEASNSVALVVQHAGQIHYERYWPPYGPETQTNPNSMHKPVLALLVGAAIDEGLIDSLDAKASKWLTEWQGDARADITVRQLLQMSSGLEIPVFGTWKSARILFGSDLVAGVLDLKAEKPAGSEYQYSNANSQLLALIIERATGESYAQYLSSRLWQRLGAGDAFLWLDREGGMPRGFCCLFATARDWLRVGELILGGGERRGQRVVSAQFVKQMLAPSPLNPNFGFQVWLGSPPAQERKYNDFTVTAYHSEAFAAEDIIYIDGYGGQRVYIVPSRQLVIVRTGVSQTDWDDAVIPNAIIRSLRQSPMGEAGQTVVPTADSPELESKN